MKPEAMALDVLLVAAMRGDIKRNPEASLDELAEMQGIASCCDKCGRCDGDGKAHGSDRPFECDEHGNYPGPCPVCKGTGKNPQPSLDAKGAT